MPNGTAYNGFSSPRNVAYGLAFTNANAELVDMGNDTAHDFIPSNLRASTVGNTFSVRIIGNFKPIGS